MVNLSFTQQKTNKLFEISSLEVALNSFLSVFSSFFGAKRRQPGSPGVISERRR
jgi:hypothetical protein